MASNEKRRDVQFEEFEYFGETSGESSNSDLTELTYLLDWTLRDEIIANLNGYTQLLLLGKKTATQEKLLQANCDLYQRLINLPLKPDDESLNQCPSKVVLELAFGVKGEILAALSTNQSLTKSGVLASKETRLKVVKRNNWLVSRLMNLPVCVSQGSGDDQTSLDANDETNSSTERSRSSETIEDLNSLVKLENGKAGSRLKRALVEIECSIDGMAAFLKSGEKRSSSFFYYNKLVWSIEISKVTKEKKSLLKGSEVTDYLSVFLRANFADGTAESSTNLSFRVTLLNRHAAFANRGFILDSREFSQSAQRWGSDLIKMQRLRNGGFIEDDQIRFRVLLWSPKREPDSSGRWNFAFNLIATTDGILKDPVAQIRY